MENDLSRKLKLKDGSSVSSARPFLSVRLTVVDSFYIRSLDIVNYVNCFPKGISRKEMCPLYALYALT